MLCSPNNLIANIQFCNQLFFSLPTITYTVSFHRCVWLHHHLTQDKWVRCKSCLLRGSVKYGTTIHMLSFRFHHGSCSRLGWKDAVIPVQLELWQEEVIKLLCLHFLQIQSEVKWLALSLLVIWHYLEVYTKLKASSTKFSSRIQWCKNTKTVLQLDTFSNN